MSVELNCWQRFWNTLCCGCCYDDPETVRQSQHLLSGQRQQQGVVVTHPPSSYSPPNPDHVTTSSHGLPSDRTVTGLSAQQVEIQRGGSTRLEEEDARRSPPPSSDLVRRDEEDGRRSPPPSSDSVRLEEKERHRSPFPHSSKSVRHTKRTDGIKSESSLHGGSSGLDKERTSSPPIPIVMGGKKDTDHSGSSEESHSPVDGFNSEPTTPVRSPASRPATPLSSPYNDTSFGDTGSNWRDQVGAHDSPHKVAPEKKKRGDDGHISD